MRRRSLFLISAFAVLIPLAAFARVTLSVSPSGVSFPVRCTFSAADPKTVTISNDGTDPATDVSVAVSPSSMAATFPIGGQTAPQQLSPGEESEFQVGFNPVHVGTTKASAVVTYTVPEPTPSPSESGPGGGGGPPPKQGPTSTPTPSTTAIPLSGNAIDRFIDVAPLGVNFGSVGVGKAGPERTITIYDDGDSPLTVTSISVGGRHAGDFRVKDFSPSIVTDGHPIKVALGFKPRASGARAAELSVHSDSCEQPTFNVQLGGIAVEPDVRLDPKTPIDFGDRAIGTQTKKGIKITNQGGLPLTIKAVSIKSEDPATNDLASFTILKKPKLPKILKPAKSIVYEVSFNPTQPGFRGLRLTIASNDPDTPVMRARIVGTGVLPPSPTPTPTTSAAPPSKGGGIHPHLGPYIPAAAVVLAIGAFFALLVYVRRWRGIPE